MNVGMFSWLLYGFVFMFTAMTAVWLVQLKTKNAGIVDAVWAISFPMLTVFYAFFLEGNQSREMLIIILSVLWGGRLGYYLFRRNFSHAEDVRYARLRVEWGPAKANRMMFLFFQFQAVIASVLSVVFLLIILNPAVEISWNEWLGVAIWFISLIGESVADNQLKNFKKKTAGSGKKEICEEGLWNYSRHPNYFFEWLTWVAFFVMAVGAPYGWVSIICPLIMLFLLLKVSGIPMTEELMLESRGELFKEYQRSTSAFFPWFKKKGSFV